MFMRRTFAVGSRRVHQPQRIAHCVVAPRPFTASSSRFSPRLTSEQLVERRAARNAVRLAAHGKETSAGSTLYIEGSVRYYTRHCVIVEPQHTDSKSWPAKLEHTPGHALSLYRDALVALYGGDVVKVRKSPLLVTAAIPYMDTCSAFRLQEEEEEEEGKTRVDRAEKGTHDVLVFPDAVRVHDVDPVQIPLLVRGALETASNLSALLRREKMRYADMEKGYHVMVCGHAARDVRCGCKGPELLQWLKATASRDDKPLHLWLSSHMGGHRFAATCVAYPTGDWFGLLNDQDRASDVLEAVTNEDPLRVYKLWRGRMGLTPHDMHRAVTERVEQCEDGARAA
ncbi:unnamed protein product [Hyaloperonospora brassicae]|uniref:Uncharacterized protein n=1 Tax=Hyaloperonospora brassicae TaxID=162125 RepID=A0AAV0UZ00_HYABA|nr:unnamed protein product [Hyaloperonospora brassicae]